MSSSLVADFLENEEFYVLLKFAASLKDLSLFC